MLLLIGHQGVRQRAALHLRWEDVDLDARVITWRARYDKVGREWSQPIRDATRSALLTALYWRERDGYTGPWVFLLVVELEGQGARSSGRLWRPGTLEGVEERRGRGRGAVAAAAVGTRVATHGGGGSSQRDR